MENRIDEIQERLIVGFRLRLKKNHNGGAGSDPFGVHSARGKRANTVIEKLRSDGDISAASRFFKGPTLGAGSGPSLMV